MKKTIMIGIVMILCLSGIALAGKEVAQSFTTGEDSGNSIYGVEWSAQTFTPATTYNLTAVKLRIYRTLNPGTINITLKATSSSHPTGVALLGLEYNGNTLPDSAGWTMFNFSGVYEVQASTMYAIEVSAINGDVNNKVTWRMDGSAGTFSGGARESSANSGGTWTTTSDDDFVFYTYKLTKNLLVVNVYDEATNTLVAGENTNLYFTGATTSYSKTLTASTYSNTFNSSNYTLSVVGTTDYDVPRYYSFEYDNTTNVTINTYLIGNSSNTQIFKFIDDVSRNSITDGVNISIYTLIGGTLTKVSDMRTDPTGRIQFDYRTYTKYWFNASKYDDYYYRYFNLDPIIAYSSGYIISLLPNSTSQQDTYSDYGLATIDVVPVLFKEGNASTQYFVDGSFNNWNNYTATFYSPTGQFNTYGINITYPVGQNIELNGSSQYGSSLNREVNISGVQIYDKVYVTYWYQLVGFDKREFKFSYSIKVAPGKYTFTENIQNTEGVGVFEKVLVATILVMIVAGITTLVAGAVTGGVFGIMLFLYFAWIGWFPTAFIFIPLLFAIVVFSWRASQ